MSEPEYGDIQLNRHLGKGTTVDAAPQRAKMAVSYLAHPGTYLRVEDGDIVIADQVVYRITGYDPDDCTLTLELIKDDPHAEAQP